MILPTIGAVIGTYVIWFSFSLYRNYVKASKIGLPVLINPIDAMNPLWLVSQDLWYPLLISLPFNLGEFATRLRSNWTFLDRYQHHAKYGSAFVEATPASVRLFFADPVAMEDLSKRRNEFYKPPMIYSAIDIFGPNLDSVNGKVWERHRRITVPPFNENNSALVWQTTIDQTSQMLGVWRSRDIVSSTQADMQTMALNVLCFAGFGIEADIVEEHDQRVKNSSGDKAKLGYRTTLEILLANFISLVLHDILVTAGYPPKWMWGGMKQLTRVKAEFKEYMQEIVDHETVQYEQGNANRHNLVSSLIRANLEMQKSEKDSDDKIEPGSVPLKGLTQDEVYGNLFIYNFAGHDTTAGTIHFALLLLAVHPGVQDWLSEEINAVRSSNDNANFYYESTFPRLKRCLALMHETLRLYGPVQTLPRATPPGITAPLTIGRNTYLIPPDTQIISNFAALHTHPEHWAPDPLAWRPSRFIKSSSSSSWEGEEFHEPAVAGTFVPWNRGPRLCPGRKFSQVEFVAAMFVLFAGGHRVKLALDAGETEEQARVRAMKVVNGATVELTLKMREDVKVQWFEKGQCVTA